MFTFTVEFMMKTLLSILLLTFLTNGYTQQNGGNHKRNKKDQPKGEIFGTIVDSITGKGVGYATIIALRTSDNKMQGGTVSEESGNFSITNLPYGSYQIKISFVGYQEKYINNIVLDRQNSTYQLKNETLAPTVLQTVEIIGDQPIITYEIDKKVINVEDQINTDGQSAAEILENIPSITVSADGTVSLRGSSSFTLLIDGIPTAMDASDALATIPASTIQDIEIITNPSAKFDAEGTSGVINIITKKSKLEGVSSLINLSTGRFNNYNGDFSLNMKKKKWTFDLSGSAGNRNNPTSENTTRTTSYDSLTNRIVSEGESSWKRSYYGGGGGIQWTPNNSHILSVRTNVKWTTMTPYDDAIFKYYDNDSLISSFKTEQHNHIALFNNTSNLYYQYNFRRNKKHHISFKAIANLKYVIQNDTTVSFDEKDNIISGNLYTETGPSNSYRFNIDYVLPVGKSNKLESGIQAQFGQSGDVGKNYVYNDSTDSFDFNSLYSSDVKYVRNVHAAYSIFGGTHKKLGYQIGLRAEHTFRTITSTQTVNFTTINRLDWFPSAHFSYSFKNKSQLIASYSRRIKRPRSWWFEPFVTWESPYEVRSGNPNLLPEYINAFELNYIKPIKKNTFFSIEGYFRKYTEVTKRIKTVYTPGVLISLPYNM